MLSGRYASQFAGELCQRKGTWRKEIPAEGRGKIIWHGGTGEGICGEERSMVILMDVLRIGILGIVGVMLALQFKANKPEYGIYIGFAVSLLIFSFVVSGLSSIFESMGIMEKYIGSDGTYFSVLLKVIGITYICEFCSGICRDAGYGSVSGQIEIFGKLSVLAAGMPILLAIIQSIQEIAG